MHRSRWRSGAARARGRRPRSASRSRAASGRPRGRSSDPVIRAVVMEDEPLARQYLCTLLAQTGKVEVVGEADNGRAGLRLCAGCAPDVALLDIRIPGPDGLSLAGRLLTL